VISEISRRRGSSVWTLNAAECKIQNSTTIMCNNATEQQVIVAGVEYADWFKPELKRADHDALIMLWESGSSKENGVEGLHLEFIGDVCASQSLLFDVCFANKTV
jgi:hypothetical protein